MKEATLEPLITTNPKLAMPISTGLSIITLNVNGLNAPIKRYTVTEWIKKDSPQSVGKGSVCFYAEDQGLAWIPRK